MSLGTIIAEMLINDEPERTLSYEQTEGIIEEFRDKIAEPIAEYRAEYKVSDAEALSIRLR